LYAGHGAGGCHSHSAEGQISGHNIEVAIVGEDQKFRVLTPAEVSDYLEEVE
jgi:20S proteasome subunit alpha 2